MAELADEWASKGIKNIWGNVPEIIEMQRTLNRVCFETSDLHLEKNSNQRAAVLWYQSIVPYRH
jgi:hypothetical protein